MKDGVKDHETIEGSDSPCPYTLIGVTDKPKKQRNKRDM
jgi:hypothetical protein